MELQRRIKKRKEKKRKEKRNERKIRKKKGKYITEEMEKKYAGLCVKFYSSYRESPTRRGNIVTSCFAARH